MTHNAPLNAPGLLVSVQSAEEAVVAATAGVGWIDIKNPASGSLGMPATDVCEEILNSLAGHVDVRTSVALGELQALDIHRAQVLMTTFEVGKVGLSNCVQLELAELVDLLQVLQSRLAAGSNLVPALYADHLRAQSPDSEVLLQLAQRLGSPYVLVDTWLKDGRGLFDWISVSRLQTLSTACASFGAKLVVAGSLRTSDWPHLEQLGDVIVGVRGAVCRNQGDRTSQICADKVAQWCAWSDRSRSHAVARHRS